MDTSQKLLELLKALAEQTPSLLALLACMVFAASRWRRHPRVSLVVLISLALLFLHGIVFAIIYNWMPDLFLRSATYPDVQSAIRRVYLVLGLLYNTALAIAFALLLVGIFMNRGVASQDSSPVRA